MKMNSIEKLAVWIAVVGILLALGIESYQATRCSDQDGIVYCTFWFKFWLLGFR